MTRAQNVNHSNVEIVGFPTAEALRITASHRWMPTSGNGKYCTIPFSCGIDGVILKSCGLPSFAGARREIQALAKEYAERAAALMTKAKQERLQLAGAVRGPDGGLLIRPYRLRLRLHLELHTGYLHFNWRGIVKKRGKWIRVRAKMWDCVSDVTSLIADAHPEEAIHVRRIEAEAADIRRRWFALVRLVHYMNVAEDHRLSDVHAGSVHTGRTKKACSRAMRGLRSLFRVR